VTTSNLASQSQFSQCIRQSNLQLQLELNCSNFYQACVFGKSTHSGLQKQLSQQDPLAVMLVSILGLHGKPTSERVTISASVLMVDFKSILNLCRESRLVGTILDWKSRHFNSRINSFSNRMRCAAFGFCTSCATKLQRMLRASMNA
jgi:hypothetical protein